jgi:hypothetical protein
MEGEITHQNPFLKGIFGIMAGAGPKWQENVSYANLVYASGVGPQMPITQISPSCSSESGRRNTGDRLSL